MSPAKWWLIVASLNVTVLMSGLSISDTRTAGRDEASMALVPAGTFLMGSETGDNDERPAHDVYLDAFYIDRYEVTIGQYANYLEATHSEPPPEWETMNQPAHQKRPVVFVDWTDASRYCHWTGKRLPTEAEWEKAARGRDSRIYPWGNESPTAQHANFGKQDWNKHAVLIPVGALGAGKSPYGVYDMAGNVREWVVDWYDDAYYRKSPAKNPSGPERGDTKVLRGGSWLHDPEYLKTTYREAKVSTLKVANYGFRCVAASTGRQSSQAVPALAGQLASLQPVRR